MQKGVSIKNWRYRRSGNEAKLECVGMFVRLLKCRNSQLAIKPLALRGAQAQVWPSQKFAWETQSSWDDGAHQED